MYGYENKSGGNFATLFCSQIVTSKNKKPQDWA